MNSYSASATCNYDPNMTLSPAQSELTLVPPSEAPAKEFLLDSDSPTDCSLYLDGKPFYVVESNDSNSRTSIRRTSQPDAVCDISWNKFSPDKIVFRGEEKVISKWLHSESILAKLKTSWVSILFVISFGQPFSTLLIESLQPSNLGRRR